MIFGVVLVGLKIQPKTGSTEVLSRGPFVGCPYFSKFAALDPSLLACTFVMKFILIYLNIKFSVIFWGMKLNRRLNMPLFNILMHFLPTEDKKQAYKAFKYSKDIFGDKSLTNFELFCKTCVLYRQNTSKFHSKKITAWLITLYFC